jgi:hypothetical protein
VTLREPILPLFQPYVNEVNARDVLSGMTDSISGRVLLHMDQCMYHYTKIGSTHDMMITRMMNIARSYILREDIRDINDIQPHHCYVIMKASNMREDLEIDVIMAEKFGSLTDIELVIDFERSESTNDFNGEILQDKFDEDHCVHYLSIMGENLTTIGDKFLQLDDDFPEYEPDYVTSFVIPKGFTHIGDYFLNGYMFLESFTIPNGITRIPDNFLNGCSSLQSLVIPDSVTTIGYNVLADNVSNI